MRLTSLLLLVLVTASCRGTAAKTLANRIEAAHGGPGWYSVPAFETRFDVELGGEPVLAGTLLFEPRSGRARIELVDGSTLVYDGHNAWATGGIENARFHLLTWPYFLGVPWKLRDKGADLDPDRPRKLDGQTYATARLTFDGGTGDTPDDWYLLFLDPASSELEALAYIVTYGKDRKEANENPSVALYNGSDEVEGLRLPRELVLYPWSEAEGAGSEPQGRARFRGTRVVTPSTNAFTAPEGAVRDLLPPRTAEP